MNRRRWWILLALAGCAVPSRPLPAPAASVDLSPVWRALDHGDLSGARQAADALNWGVSQSVEAERLRQSLHLSAGRRGALVADLEAWSEQSPEHPDLAYLEARLLQQPERQEARFRELARRYPEHAWIRLGLAGLAQQLEDWSEAAAHLQAAPDWPEARAFRRLLFARQLVAADRALEALRLLEPAAFAGGQREALLEYIAIAERSGQSLALARASSEYRLRTLEPEASAVERIERAFQRLDAELKLSGRLDLEQSLGLFDGYLRRAGAPAGWRRQPRYELAPVGALARPERGSGGVAAAWARHGRMLIAGEALTRGVELLMLRDVRVVPFSWPGEPQPLELVLAASASSTRSNTVVGGAVFHGFYLRRDFAAATAAGLEEEAAGVDLDAPLPARAGGGPWLPEDYDLPARLRAARLRRGGASALQLELGQIFLHECGHLPETLQLTGARPRPDALLWRGFGSWLRYGDPLAWMERRAQARALAASPEPHWVLADTVQRARTPGDAYRLPYAALLRDLLAEAERRGLPPLFRWHELSTEILRELAAAACVRGGFEPLPAELVAPLLAAQAELLAE